MAWGKNGSTTLSSAGDTITASDITSNKTNLFLVHTLPDSGQIANELNFGYTSIDTGNNYSSRYASNGINASRTSQNDITLQQADYGNALSVIYAVNIATKEKLTISFQCETNSTGAGSAPSRTECVGKWANTSNQFDNVRITNWGTGDYGSGSNLSALGSELTPASATTIETGSIYIDTDTNNRWWFNGSEWKNPDISTYGVFAGGYDTGGAPSENDTIDYITIATTGNATDFGDLTQARYSSGGVSSMSRGVIAGGSRESTPYETNVIDYVTIGTPSNATDFGDMTFLRGGGIGGGIDDNSRGLFMGGYTSPTRYNTIEYITIATTGNATDFGDMTVVTAEAKGLSDDTRGVISIGYSGGFINNIDYVTIQTTGNATDFGDMTGNYVMGAGTASSTRGVWGGGYDSGYTRINVIAYVTIQTTGNATDFGDLTLARHSTGAVSNLSRGVWGGGSQAASPYRTVTTDYVTIDTTGNATDFGDLTVARQAPAGMSGG